MTSNIRWITDILIAFANEFEVYKKYVEILLSLVMLLHMWNEKLSFHKSRCQQIE